MFAIQGSSSSSDSDAAGDGHGCSDSDMSSDEVISEATAWLGLKAKDLQRGPGVVKLEDLSVRQLALVMCGASPCLCIADLVDLGGEMAS